MKEKIKLIIRFVDNKEFRQRIIVALKFYVKYNNLAISMFSIRVFLLYSQIK